MELYTGSPQNDLPSIEILRDTLKKVKKENKKVIICGDFNYNLLNHENNEIINSFLNTLLECSLQPCITEPTRIVDMQRTTLVDNIFINTLDKVTSGNFLENISHDHLPNFVIIPNDSMINKKPEVKSRDTRNFIQENFDKDLCEPELVQQILLSPNTNQADNIFHPKFLETLKKHAPIKFLSKKEIKIKHKPWLTTGILISIREKRKLFCKYKKKSSDANSYDKYKFYRNTLNSLIRKSKKKHYVD